MDIKAIFKIHSFLTLDSQARLHHRHAWGNGYSASSSFADAKGTKYQSTLVEDSCLLTKSWTSPWTSTFKSSWYEKWRRIIVWRTISKVRFLNNYFFRYAITASAYFLYFFSSNIIYFGQRSQLKSKFFRFSSAWVEIRQIPHVNFGMTSQFPFKFCIILHCRGT